MVYKIGKHDILVDEHNYWILEKHKWKVDERKNQNYVKASIKIDGKWRYEYLHRLIMKPNKGLVVDHINGNTLDNRLENLRVCTQGENVKNCIGRNGTSKYKSVYWDKKRGKWYAEIKNNKKKIYVGLFDDEISAAIAVDVAMKKHHGEYAKPNFKSVEV